ncbi:MAG: prolyl oligopeptidase family serine peptidase [Gemmataceae bacterium]
MTHQPHLALAVLVLAVPLVGADQPTGYLKPPAAIQKVLDLPAPPSAALSPNRDYLVLVEGDRYPSIGDLARPILRLAGLRIDPRTNGPQSQPRTRSMMLRPLAGGKDIAVIFPEQSRPGFPAWSPDGKRFAVLLTMEDGIEVWLGSPEQPRLRKLEGVRINGAFGQELTWMPDSEHLLLLTIPADRGAMPQAPTVPASPIIQESSGRPSPVRTFQDLLKNKYDEALFDYYCTSQLVLANVVRGSTRPVGKPAIFARSAPSPDGKYLLISRVQRPYSYVVPAGAFGRSEEIWTTEGRKVRTLAELPLQDNIPIEGVPTGPRNLTWRADRPATLIYAEALDGGDPARKVPHRDRLWSLAAPFTEDARELTKTEHRLAGLTWGEKGQALLSDYDRETRRRRTWLVHLDDPNAAPRLLWDRSIQDRYNDPGVPQLRRLPSGYSVLRQDGDFIFLEGDGASPKGNRPFLDRFNLKTLKAERLFQSEADCYETVEAILSPDGRTLLTRHESPTSPPNFRMRTAGKKEFRAVTAFPDPAPELQKITRKLVRYKRADGVPLSFTLYLPPNYKEGTRLPTVVWAYPREFTDASVAGQVFGSTSRYTRLGGTSHLFFLLAGYAVLDNTSMPVVGSSEKANDTFLEQIVSSAKAAIDKAVEMGVTDPDRVGVGGHSYGAFMTANLLAHSDLFRAGIARSGAYNRTLTPFGFQSERRTLWQVPEIYMRLSPFLVAHKINEPLLLIHGEADNNPGTFPMQSDRMYQAIRGNGGTVRYVVLPHESHGYFARESVEHTLAEMVSWFDRHVKHAPPRKKEGKETDQK